MPIIQHLGTAFASGGGKAESLDPFGDGSCRSYYPLDNNGLELINGWNIDSSSGAAYTANAKIGTHAYTGNGSNYLQQTQSDVGNVSDYTINFWYKSSVTSQSNKRLVTLKAASWTSGWSNYAGSLGFYTGNASGWTTSVTRRMQLPDGWVNDNQWHMLTSTMTNGNSYNIYIDGSPTSGSSNQGDGRSFNVDSYLAITCYNQSTGYNTQGFVDNLRIFSRVLSSTEIATLYANENV